MYEGDDLNYEEEETPPDEFRQQTQQVDGEADERRPGEHAGPAPPSPADDAGDDAHRQADLIDRLTLDVGKAYSRERAGTRRRVRRLVVAPTETEELLAKQSSDVVLRGIRDRDDETTSCNSQRDCDLAQAG